LEQALIVLGAMKKEGVITDYAVGGAIAAMFYVETVLTYDLDVFVLLPKTQTTLVTLSPIYEYVRKRGYEVREEHVIIEGIPVQMIPAYNPLVEEAVVEAAEMTYGRTRIRVLRAEHLLAIMLQTSRPKDKERMAQFLDEAEVDVGYLSTVLSRHGLARKWRGFKRQRNGP
jgi:hypothetical protein